jgi:hypothetical protein
MMKIADLSKDHRTTLRTQVLVGAAARTLEVSVPGRDVWAYQFAKIQLQNAVCAQRRAASTPTLGTSSS